MKFPLEVQWQEIETFPTGGKPLRGRASSKDGFWCTSIEVSYIQPHNQGVGQDHMHHHFVGRNTKVILLLFSVYAFSTTGIAPW